MRRLRFYKILLPIVLVVFLVLLFRALDPPAGSHTAFNAPSKITNTVQGVAYSEFDGAAVLFDLAAGSVEEDQGRVSLDQIRQLRYFREGAQPLLFSAGRGDITGKPGQRVLRFEGDVVVDDPDTALTLRIRNLEVDQDAQEARTTEIIELEGNTLSGQALGLVYSLRGEPARVNDLGLLDAAGTRLDARRGVLHDGLRDVELFDAVRVSRAEEFLAAERMRIYRRPDDSLKRLEALDSVSASLRLSGGATLAFDAYSLNLDFDEDAELGSLEAATARLDSGVQRLQAQTLRARRVGATRHQWRVVADGSVLIESEQEGAPALLRADSTVALLDQAFSMIEVTASGEVRFDADQTHAESDWAAYSATRDEIRLLGSAKRKARLARQDTRVAAERITTDGRGSRLLAEDQVEATLLAQGRSGADTSGLFRGDAAVHFVANRLEANDSASDLTFSGGVRGWQGDRTLSADVLILNQAARTLLARDGVAARIPRSSTRGGTSEADFIQIGAARLAYSEASRVAEFHDDVRVQIAEGWVEGVYMRLTLSQEAGVIELIEAEGDVRLEFHGASGQDPPQVMSGTADRMKYDPRSATVWLMGDNSPATVRRVGTDHGTTSGRVLRYQLDSGTLEVDSGASGPARIRTSER